MSDIRINAADLFELRNNWQPDKNGEEKPTLSLEAGIWTTDVGDKSGVLISTFGALSPLIEPRDAVRLAKWLMAAAETLSGEKTQEKRSGQKKRRYDEEDE